MGYKKEQNMSYLYNQIHKRCLVSVKILKRKQQKLKPHINYTFILFHFGQVRIHKYQNNKNGKNNTNNTSKTNKQIDKWMYTITKTYLYNIDPLKPHFYIVKLGFTGVYIIFVISAQKHRLWVLVRTASTRRFYRVPTIYVLSRNMKNIRFFL